MRIIILLIALTFTARYAPPSVAETITITAGEWPPYLSANLKHHGIAGRVITEAFAQADIKVNFVMLPWKRAYTQAQTGDADATAVWLKNPEREKIFHFSNQVIVETHVFFFKKGITFDWQTIADITPFKLGGLIGFSYGAQIDTLINAKKVRIERVGNDVQNYHKLLTNRIDIYPQEINVGYEILHQNFLKGEIASIDHHPKPFLINPSYLLLPKQNSNSQRLLEIFNTGLAKLKKEGKLEAYTIEARQGAYAKP